MKKSNMKKMLAAGISVALIAAISIMGTLAYLTAQQNEEVVNTFVAAGGGDIIDPNPPEPGPDEPDLPDGLDRGFFLVEHEVSYDNTTAAYSLNNNAYALAGNYEKVVPNMTLPKDPFVKADIVTGVKAYVFVQVTNGLNTALTATIDTSNWTQVPGVADVYYYSGSAATDGVITGKDGYDVVDAGILENDEITVGNFDGDTLTAGALGNLTFKAYACQAEGFDNAADAWTKVNAEGWN